MPARSIRSEGVENLAYSLHLHLDSSGIEFDGVVNSADISGATPVVARSAHSEAVMLATPQPVRETPSTPFDWCSPDTCRKTANRAILLARCRSASAGAGLSLTLPRQTVSGMHAELYEKIGDCSCAISGTNGTFVNETDRRRADAG